MTQLSSYLAWWGAAISTILALIKIWEFWQDRFRVDVGYNFTGDPELGNEIYIRNLSAQPIILKYWKLFYVSGIWPFRKFSEFESPGPYARDIQIAPHSSKELTFREASYFDWGAKFLTGRKIYMRLYIVGRRSILRKLYG